MIASELESPNSPSQKPYQCRICQKAFASKLKADHHEHKEHGQPRKVSLDIGSANRSRQPSNPFVFSASSDAKKKDHADESAVTPGADTSSTSSTSPTKLHGDVDLLSGLPKMDDQMMAEYGLTPSVFEDGFRSTLGMNPLNEALRSQGGLQSNSPHKRKPGLSPRILNPAPRPTAAVAPDSTAPAPAQEENSTSGGFSGAAETRPTTLPVFTSLPKSPGAFFYTHVTPEGMFVHSPVLPLSPLQQLLPMLNGANGMGNPFMFSMPSSPTTVQPLGTQAFAQAGGGLIPTSPVTENGFHNGFPFNLMQAPSLPPAYIESQLAQLQDMWASPYPTDLRDSVTPMSEASSNPTVLQSDKPKKKGGRPKRKIDELLSENSDSISVVSSEISASVSSANKRSRPILDTDDPVLADKRRRNRVAAEKCRLKRKARQVSLEEQNDILVEKIRVMEKRHQELAAISQEVVNKLQKENSDLKLENAALRKLLPIKDGMTTKVDPFPVILKSNPT
ncbi:hypothetical protein RvY_14417 [Ramazzottius varieornatus]|uniref:C2H2-type domain-containing protein n=1 Tax=Ramazzottius varieornatus TaxID=947166 RepID=A0A1D1VYK2_RAMVA|nr:hypothetical protein RvY_14417 [Ramazzottius varieornatus]